MDWLWIREAFASLELTYHQLTIGDGVALLLLGLQLPATAILLARLLRGPFRRPPLRPQPECEALSGRVSAIVPTLNEAHRIQPCLDGLTQQGPTLREIVVVDSRSTDGTVAKVDSMQARDRRFRVETDEPLPAGWVGRPWALHAGYQKAHPGSSWILGIDADTHPQPGLVAGLLHVAETESFDLITLSPRFILQHLGEAWLQPALLMTLIYRFGAAGDIVTNPDRVMANGQCCLIRKTILDDMGGYEVARASFCDDVTLVRAAARRGYKVGFMDGAHLIHVRMYESAAETWTEWGRSLDLKDASTFAQTLADTTFLLLVQALPLSVLTLLVGLGALCSQDWIILSLLGTNLGLVAMRWGLLLAIANSYCQRPWTYWVSPLADPLAVLRILLSALTRPQSWRGRDYSIPMSGPQ
ncbi:MAG: glycosyltransferase family 2 protein [Cyanobacteria bacterium P01_F01_bin.33]